MTHLPPLLTKTPFQINEIPCYRYRGAIAALSIAALSLCYHTYHSGIVCYHYVSRTVQVNTWPCVAEVSRTCRERVARCRERVANVLRTCRGVSRRCRGRVAGVSRCVAGMSRHVAQMSRTSRDVSRTSRGVST